MASDAAELESCISLFVLALLALISFALSRRRRALWEMAICAGLAVFAFRSVRHTPLFAIAALAFVPPHLADVILRFRDHFSGLEELSGGAPRRWRLRCCWQ
jgi:hypothetical protein